MRANRKQLLDAAYFAAHRRARRRSVPTRPSTPMPRSLQERWRERPRCRARHLTPRCPDGVVHAIGGRGPCQCGRARFVQERRATRMPTGWAGSDRRTVPVHAARIGSRMSTVLPPNLSMCRAQFEARHHRTEDADAVLAVVNALRFASTRPVAGPSGIDDACARRRWATVRW